MIQFGEDFERSTGSLAVCYPVATRFDCDRSPHLQGMRGGKDGLLSVREVAEQLGLCTATVYGLCAEGALAHVRILNAIRIAPADLATFVEARRIGSRR